MLPDVVNWRFLRFKLYPYYLKLLFWAIIKPTMPYFKLHILCSLHTNFSSKFRLRKYYSYFGNQNCQEQPCLLVWMQPKWTKSCMYTIQIFGATSIRNSYKFRFHLLHWSFVMLELRIAFTLLDVVLRKS